MKGIHLSVSVGIVFLSVSSCLIAVEAETRAQYVQNMLQELFKGKKPGEQCEKKKLLGKIPSADKGDSPTNVFGYPVYNQDENATILRPGVSLSYLFGFMQPVKVGSRDFFAQGSPKVIYAFLQCFDAYEVIGSYLRMDGHWDDSSNSKHPLFMQVQNVDKTKSSMATSAAEIMVKEILRLIVKQLNPKGIVEAQLKVLVGSEVKSLLDALDKISNSFPGTKKIVDEAKALVQKFVGSGSKKLTKKELVQAVVNFLASDVESEASKIWKNLEAADMKQKVQIKFTMYPSNSRAAATFMFSGSRILIDEARKAFETLLVKSPLSKLYDKTL